MKEQTQFDVVIRPASLDDDAAVARLTRELGYQATTATARERLAQLLAIETEAVFVAVVGGEVVGWIQMGRVASLESGDFAEIRGLIVSESVRSRGIGALLVGAGEEWARDRHLERMRVRSNVVRADARRFYERLGYDVTKAQNVFDKSLESERPG